MKTGRDFLEQWLTRQEALMRDEANNAENARLSEDFLKKYGVPMIDSGLACEAAMDFSHDFVQLCMLDAGVPKDEVWNNFYASAEDAIYYAIMLLSYNFGSRASADMMTRCWSDLNFYEQCSRVCISEDVYAYWNGLVPYAILGDMRRYERAFKDVFAKYGIGGGTFVEWRDSLRGILTRVKRCRGVVEGMSRKELRELERAERISEDFGRYLKKHGASDVGAMQKMMKKAILLLTDAGMDKNASLLGMCYVDASIAKKCLPYVTVRSEYDYWRSQVTTMMRISSRLPSNYVRNFVASFEFDKHDMARIPQMSIDDYGRRLREVVARS